jgi:nucleotide-binding universal stress UspA family protein
MIQKILFPVDFSPVCAAMAPNVKRAAEFFGSEVTLLHVCDLASHNGFELYARPLQEIAEDHWGIAQHKLSSFLESEFPAATCPRTLHSGDAAEQIADVARAGGFDLIAMPTHAGRFRRMLLGSTTAKVLHDADCPVLTTEHAETIAPRPLEHRAWVCALSLSRDSERVLRVASSAAAAARAKLTVVHVAQDGAIEKQEAQRRLSELLQAIGCQAAVTVCRGSVKEAVLEVGQRFDADVVIIGRPLREGARGRMRDLTYAIIRDSPFPVLSV